MEDPGFLSGLIGWVIGFAMGIIVEQIKIVLSFPEQLEKLKNQENYASFCGHNSTCSPKLKNLLEKVSPTVESGGAVRRFNIISRYVLCKRMTTLISEIEKNQPLLFYHIGAAASWKKHTEAVGEVPGSMPTLERNVVPINFLSRYVNKPVVAAAVGAVTTMAAVTAWQILIARAPADQRKKKPAKEDHPPMPEVPREVSIDITVPPVAAPLLAEAAPAPVLSEVAVVTTPDPLVSVVATETAPSVHAESEADSEALVTPGSDEVLMNRGSFSGFMGIFEHMNIDVSGRKQLASLEDLAMEIRPTIAVLKERVTSTSGGNGSGVQAWFQQFDKHLEDADKMIKKHKGHFIYNGKARKNISCLISEINALLKWGQVIISFECLNIIR